MLICICDSDANSEICFQLEEMDKMGDIVSEISVFQSEIEKALETPIKSRKRTNIGKYLSGPMTSKSSL